MGGKTDRHRCRYVQKALPETGTVTSHAKAMFRKTFQSVILLDLTRPTKITAPTKQCVVLIGMPKLEARSTVKTVPNSIIKPLKYEENVN